MLSGKLPTGNWHTFRLPDLASQGNSLGGLASVGIGARNRTEPAGFGDRPPLVSKMQPWYSYRRKEPTVKKTTTIIAIVLAVAAIAKAAPSVVRFSGGVGVIPTGSANTSVRGVPAAGQIWVIRDLTADVKVDGSIRVAGRGLLLGSGDAVGGNANASVFATLFCANDGNIQHSSNPAGVPLEVDGDFTITDTLSPAVPSSCTQPVLLIRVTAGAWFAAGIPRN